MNIGCARHSSSKLDSALACTTFKFFEYLAALGRAQASLALLLLARHLNSLNFGCTQYSSSKLGSIFVCTKFPRERPFNYMIPFCKKAHVKDKK